jgi:hypothetical protein
MNRERPAILTCDSSAAFLALGIRITIPYGGLYRAILNIADYTENSWLLSKVVKVEPTTGSYRGDEASDHFLRPDPLRGAGLCTDKSG